MSDSSNDTLSCLLQRARANDANALGRLLDMYRSYLGLLARLQIDRRLKGKASASDVVQETFLRAQEGFAEFRGSTEQELIVWLRKILATRMANLVRHYTTQRRNIDLERQLDADLHRSSAALCQQIPATIDTPSEMAANQERGVQLAVALDRLSPDYREIIVLRHLEGLSFAEVAVQTGRTVDSVKGIWMRAIRRLQHELC